MIRGIRDFHNKLAQAWPILLIVSIFISFPAFSQSGQFCAPSDQMSLRLYRNYNEYPVGQGVAHAGRGVIILYLSPEGSWSIVVRGLDGTSCFVHGGMDWQFEMFRPRPKDDPA
jgi:hypothetical protein